jgi:flagellar assembly protein FliH
MPTVIKAGDRQGVGRGVAFNFEDLSVRAEGYLKQVREQAGQILLQASQEAERIRQAAAEEGRLAAERAADQILDQKLARQLETLLPALQAAIGEIERSKQGWLAHWEQRAIGLAAAMAARVCRRELQHQPEIPLHLVKEALELSSAGARVRVLLNPVDFSALGAQLQKLSAEFSRLADAEVAPDERVSRGGCRVETQHGAIDQQFETQLNRIEQELS